MYYLVLVLLSSFSLLSSFFKRERVYFLYIISFVVLFLFAGLRQNVGYDYDNYQTIYVSIKSGDFIFVEPLFYMLIKIFQVIGLNYSVFLLGLAFISLTIKFSFLKKYSLVPIVSILLYYSRIYLNTDFGQLRQGLALGIILFTYPYILSRDIVKYSVLVVVAALVHSSAILFFPIYFIVNKLYSRKTLLITVSFAMVIASIDLKVFLLTTFEKILPAGLAFKLFFYTTTEESLGITFSVILRLMIVLFCLFVLWDKIKHDRGYLVIFNIYFFGYIFYLVFNSLPQLGGRGSIYFQQFELLLLPLMLVLIKDHVVKFIFVIFLIFYSFWGVKTILDSVDKDTSYFFEPYESIL